ncbi:hypothetical protein VM1G_02157 [Cytospora mali]|uniref:AB hydrolase-1 domain-containing protein n=1 Tax=Cytospora mali TaxID=578113 RepID=A0A194VRA5_CYTMA|nr:hypothetical protein VM1G_02157 [Valsa mali]
MPGKQVKFKTLDGLTLAGVLYSADQRGPGVIITPGFNCVKEMFISEVAEEFQKHGITALIYDPRNLGDSEGNPRNDIDPVMQISDYSDALTYMRTLPIVDPERIAFWGQSFAGCIALCAAALDKRAKLCIAVCPLLNYELPPEKFPRVLAMTMRDRESQAAGNPPMTIPVLNSQGQNPAGLGLGATTDELDYMLNAQSRGAPNYKNQTTIQSYYKLMKWQPHGIMRYIDPTPVMMVIPELDALSPPEEQHALFTMFPEPKLVYVAHGKGHLDVLSGEDFPELAAMQAEFVKSHT